MRTGGGGARTYLVAIFLLEIYRILLGLGILRLEDGRLVFWFIALLRL